MVKASLFVTRASARSGVLLLGVFATLDAYAELGATADNLFSAIGADQPGCAAGVINDGSYVLKNGYGLANLEYGIPIDANTVFRTGSVSKQFTAAAIALLAEAGSLDLDADVHEYLPDLAEFSAPVSVRQMVHHVAGMGDYDLPVFRAASGKPFRFGNEDYWTIEEFYAAVRQAPLIGPPGDRWVYSNLGYFLLGQVVERASKSTLREFAHREIFAPLGMRKSFFNDNVNLPVERRADGYRRTGSGYEIFMTNLDWVGDGGVYTSLNDFIAWDRNFYANRLGSGSSQLMSLLTEPLAGVVAREHEVFGESGYAFGQFVGRYRDEPVIYHSGGWVGFSSMYVRFPNRRLSAVVFCNSTDVSAAELGTKLAVMAFDAYAN